LTYQYTGTSLRVNAGHEGAVIVRRVCDSKDDNFGFNAESGEYGDMLEAGVIDPAKVTRLALQNAASTAALMLTTEALIADFKGEERRLWQARAKAGAWEGCTKVKCLGKIHVAYSRFQAWGRLRPQRLHAVTGPLS
jgi:hypothetical protein